VVGGEAKAGEKERVRLDVTLDNGRKVQATILGQDPKTDIALIKIQDSDLKQLEQSGIKLSSIKLGDSSNMEVGDWVLAIGAPFGLAQTVTAGIISATGRSNVGIVGIEDFIQTDAPSTPATAAAPWSTSRASRSGSTPPSPPAVSPAANVGIGFAIPTAMVEQILPDWRRGVRSLRLPGRSHSRTRPEPGGWPRRAA